MAFLQFSVEFDRKCIYILRTSKLYPFPIIASHIIFVLSLLWKMTMGFFQKCKRSRSWNIIAHLRWQLNYEMKNCPGPVVGLLHPRQIDHMVRTFNVVTPLEWNGMWEFFILPTGHLSGTTGFHNTTNHATIHQVIGMQGSHDKLLVLINAIRRGSFRC